MQPHPDSKHRQNFSSSPGLSSERRAVVDKAREEWIRRLIDLSRRNNLLYFRDLKTGTLDLTDGDAEAVGRLLAGETVPLARLLPHTDDVKAAARLQQIRRRALSNLEERGLETLFLALGMASWKPADEGRPPESAVLLVPVGVEVRGREGRNLALRRTGDVQANLVLLHLLSEYGCRLTAEQLLEDTETEEGPFDLGHVFARLREAAQQVPEFAVKSRVVLGNFSFQKMAMVKDLRERAAEMAAHDLIAAIAGDKAAREAIQDARADTDPRELDKIDPNNEFLILDADSSQQCVVAAVLPGQDGVIQGPPGTGKSQTIANLIAELVAQGRRILFVAEKRAALDVVLRRLEDVGLGHLALDLHGADVSRKQVMERLKRALATLREAMPVDSSELHQTFTDRRRRLNEHVNRLHKPRAPSGRSVYELQGMLLRLPGEARVATRFRGEELNALTSQQAAAVRDLLVEAAGFEELFLRNDPSPWTGARIVNGATVQKAMDLAQQLATRQWPNLRSQLTELASSTGLKQPETLEQAQTLVSVVKDVATTLAAYDARIFREDLTALEAALAPAARRWPSRVWAWCTKSAYREARRRLRILRRSGKLSAKKMLEEVSEATTRLRHWREWSSEASIPIACADIENVSRSLEQLVSEATALASIVGRDLHTLALDSLGRLMTALAADTVTPYRLPRLHEIEGGLERAGVGGFILELRSLKPASDLWLKMFDYAWLSSSLDRARSEDPEIAGFNGRTHAKFVEEFCKLDRQRLRVAIQRIRRAHGEAAIRAMNVNREQAQVVSSEVQKKTRHLPLRRLLAEAPDVLTAICPCWMTSPLAVSQLLGADRRYFDVVIFDEASQVLPEDAVCAFLRASQAIVAGDQRQLPPTTFFVAGEDEDEEVSPDDATAGFESVLDVMASFLSPWSLDWHYRSLDESLIAFSNRHIYGDRLITFPGPGGSPSVSHVLVPYTPGQDGNEESAAPEVRRVAELVLEQAQKRPHETLGIIAMGITHARRIEAAIDSARLARPDLDEFFNEARSERFFVKNLERVQGDERDAIILTVGYGKDRSGRLLYRFGPLNQAGGERRLNVAITRARRRMTVVSSFDHHDMDPSRIRPDGGVGLLRLYIQYAATNGARLGDREHTSVPLNAFEADVLDALSAKGLPLSPQWGASSYRIDIVARHPKRPGRFVLAIECDGASYHSAPTARDRDRLRQQHLEALGWRFHRIWSTDWFMRRDEEIQRAIAAFEAAVQNADRDDSGEGGSRGNDCPNNLVATSNAARGGDAESRRAPRPNVGSHTSISEYTSHDLSSLVRWIESDGRLRTDDEIVDEMVEELGFRRRGARIESAIREAIALARL